MGKSIMGRAKEADWHPGKTSVLQKRMMANRATAGENRPIKMWCWGMREEKMDITICVFTSLAAEPRILEKIKIHPGLRCLSGDLIPDGVTAKNSAP